MAKYDAVVLNNTTQLAIPDDGKKQALLDFVRGGKGIVGIHAATDNFYKWPEAAAMMGGLFAGHPWGGGGTALCQPGDGTGYGYSQCNYERAKGRFLRR